MTAHLINFATHSYHHAQDRLMGSAKTYFTGFHSKRETDLPVDFREKHKEHFRYARGYGFWVWKPWLILETLNTLDPSDFLMWCDAQIIFIKNPSPLFKLAKKCLSSPGVKVPGVLLFHQRRERHVNKQWTKRRCFEIMGCLGEQYEYGPQLNSAMSIWMRTPESIAFLEEWQGWCSNFECVNDMPNKEALYFRDHRHDQSILSLLAIKHGIETWPDPSQFGNDYKQPGRRYEQILEFNRFVTPPYKYPCVVPQEVLAG